MYPFQGTGSKYFVISQAWNGERGAITWIDTATGKLADGSTGGAVGTANSLVGVDAATTVGSLRAVYTYNPLTGFYQTIYQPTYQKVGEGSGILFFDGYFGGAGVVANAKGAVSWMNISGPPLGRHDRRRRQHGQQPDRLSRRRPHRHGPRRVRASIHERLRRPDPVADIRWRQRGLHLDLG